MVNIVWEFRVKKGKRKEFERHYCGTGTWARLFRKSPAYRGAVLMRNRRAAQSYLLFDRWNDLQSYRQFKKKHAAEYHSLDERCMALTESEREIGIFNDL
jgi:heme-degrading monooxygenase HmoA